MSGKAFFDSNILIYAFGSIDAKKSRLAQDIFVKAGASHTGFVSYQVVQEFLNIALKKFQPHTTQILAEKYMREIVFSMDIVPWSTELMSVGLAIKERFGFSWYDSLIVAAALTAGCETLFTEDLQSGQIIEGLTILNPFL